MRSEMSATIDPSSRYGETYYREQMTVSDAAYELVGRLRCAKSQPHVRPTDRVFEFGVGNGLAISSLNCAERVGYDINPNATAEARKRGVKIVESLDDIGTFDVVICHHCLEHLAEPSKALSTMRRLLKPSGKLLVYVPYEEQTRYQAHIKGEPNHHLYSWTPHTLANLIEDHDFDIQLAQLGLFGYDRYTASLSLKLRGGFRLFLILRWLAHLIKMEREIQIVGVKRQQKLDTA